MLTFKIRARHLPGTPHPSPRRPARSQYIRAETGPPVCEWSRQARAGILSRQVTPLQRFTGEVAWPRCAETAGPAATLPAHHRRFAEAATGPSCEARVLT